MKQVRDGKIMKKTDIVREAIKMGDWKKALCIAKNFRIGVTKEQKEVMTRAYECIVYPEFYRQLGIDIVETIEKGKEVIIGLYGA